MKKFLTLISILFASLLCTAFINNLAISELNQMGAEYLQKGDYDNAIARFKSSVDLDENIFESRYNLGVAYVSKEDYKNAIPELEYAVKLKPDSKEAAYSLAVALESEGFAFEENLFDETADNTEENAKKVPSRIEVIEGLKYVVKAISVYEDYLKLTDDSNETVKIQEHIKNLKNVMIWVW